jgi:hypothetical protein
MGTLVLLLGIVCFVVGAVFIWQSIDLRGQVVNSMQIEKATYGGAPERINSDGEVIVLDEQIEGIIDTENEAELMADTLQSHRLSQYPPYTEMDRDDPDRNTVIHGMALQNSLVIAQIGFGVSTMALGIGLFMLVTGIAFGGTGLVLRRR